MVRLVNRFWRDETGATAIEYGLIAALIALAVVVGGTAVGNAISTKFKAIANKRI